MKRLLAILMLGGLLVPVASHATSWYVDPANGNDGNSGTSFSNGFKTITHANGLARPGDKVYLLPGQHIGIPNPDSAESNPDGRISYIGASLHGDPITDTTIRKTIKLGGGNITKNSVSLLGICCPGAPVWIAADRCSIAYCHSLGDLFGIQSAKYSVIDHNYMYGTQSLWMAGEYRESGLYQNRFFVWALANSETLHTSVLITPSMFGPVRAGDRIGWREELGPACIVTAVLDDSTLIMSDSTNAVIDGDETSVVFYDSHFISCITSYNIAPRTTGSWRMRGIDSCLFVGNQINSTVNSTDEGEGFQIHYDNRDSKWMHNRIIGVALATSGSNYVMDWRDHCARDTIQKDTLICLGPGYTRIGWAASGSEPHSVQGLVIDSLFYYNVAQTDPNNDDLNSLTIRNSVWITPGDHCLLLPLLKGKTVIEHNTFVGDPERGIVCFDDEGNSPMFSDTCFFRSNILYATRYINAPDPLPFQPNNTGGTQNCAVWWSNSRWDSTGQEPDFPLLQSNNNLMYHLGWYETSGQTPRRIYRDILDMTYSTYSCEISEPGDSSATNLSLWEGTWHKDSLSMHANPLFLNTNTNPNASIRRGTNFDPRLSDYSEAVGAAHDGGDIGAVTVDSLPNAYYTSQLLIQHRLVATYYITVYNAAKGNVDLVITDATTPCSSLSVVSPSATIHKGESHTFTVNYTIGLDEIDGNITFVSNNPHTISVPVSFITTPSPGPGAGGTMEP